MANRVCMAIIENDRIVLVQQRYRGKLMWTLPGGSIDDGETLEEAAIREVKEEVNVVARITRFIYSRPRNTGEGTYYCFQGEIISGEISLGYDPEQLNKAPKLLDVGWFDLTELHANPEIKRLLENL